MLVITCCNKTFNIPHGGIINSKYIRNVVETTTSEGVDVTIPVDDKYCTVVEHYVEYVGGNKTPITSRDRLLLCFQLNVLLDDNGYFDFLVEQVFTNWSYMCNMVYNEFNDSLQQAFFVLAPYAFIPKHALDNTHVMDRWEKLNQGVIINVNNNNEIYYNNIKSTNKFGLIETNTYHTVNGVEIGHNRKRVYTIDGLPIQEYNYNDGVEDGVRIEWYDTQREINIQHNVKFEQEYVDGERDGSYREWYDDDQHNLKLEASYLEGKLNGDWTEWYNNDHHSIKSKRQYINGERHGHCVEFDYHGNIISDTVFSNGELVLN